ncbi:chromosome partitioning protein [Streptacidiphilus sp. 4-A2]|nr:chromosome partitioning protein [Streptacidiphilus sp. 4-A2]
MFAWLVRKAKRVAGRADGEVDRTLDEAMDRLHDLVSEKLGEDPALHRLADEAGAGQEQPGDRTRQRVRLALEDAAEQDPGFREALERAVEQVRFLDRAAPAMGGVTAGTVGRRSAGTRTSRPTTAPPPP